MPKRIMKLKQTDWPREMRILVNKICNYGCSFPGTCEEWCHKDGVRIEPNKKRKEATVDDWIFLTKSIKDYFGITKVKIGAMEPLIYGGSAELIKNLKGLGIEKVSLTTNGYFLEDKVDELKESGLDMLTISMHAFNAEDYKRIIKVDGFEKAKKAVEKASNYGFEKLKINRVMLQMDNLWQDLTDFFDWAAKHKIGVKLYKLIWSEKMSEKRYFESYVAWEGLMAYLAKNGELISRYIISASGRERLTWKLANGLEIETDVFSHKLGEEMPKLCRECRLAPFCQEGLMSYGIEVNPDMIMSACLLRDEISLDMWKEVKKRNAEGVLSKMRLFVEKSMER